MSSNAADPSVQSYCCLSLQVWELVVDKTLRRWWCVHTSKATASCFVFCRHSIETNKERNVAQELNTVFSSVLSWHATCIHGKEGRLCTVNHTCNVAFALFLNTNWELVQLLFTWSCSCMVFHTSVSCTRARYRVENSRRVSKELMALL